MSTLTTADVYAKLLALKNESSKNEKIAALKIFMADPDFIWFLQAMLDPRHRFGMAKKTLDGIEKKNPGFGENVSVRAELEPLLENMMLGVLSGAEAEATIANFKQTHDEKAWHVLRAILEKKPGAGFTASSVNKARKGTIWTFDCMLAHKFEEHRVKKWPVAVEPKIDGVRCLIMLQPTRSGSPDIGFFSRSGNEYTTFGHLEEPLSKLWELNATLLSGKGGAVIDCEMDSGQFNETVSQARKKEGQATDAVARCFDFVTGHVWTEQEKSPTYVTRRGWLTQFVGGKTPLFDNIVAVHAHVANSAEDVMALHARFQAEGLEGTIVKPLDHLYQRKRSHDWMKTKGFETHDLIITGMFEGARKYEGQMGGVIVDMNGVDVRVGGGWSDDDRRVMWENQSDYIGRMIEVGAHEMTPDGSLRHPRFIRWRDDKHSPAEAA